ncbi:hypothetical protein GmHk_17G049870 [Glycine max]|nr:hypothetical protein GmHk_17G049870 [Glycine max]
MDGNINLILHHGGRFTPHASDGKVEYIGGEFDVWEDISADYINIFILYDLVKACKKYSSIGDCFWLIDNDLDFNHGLRSCTTDGDILYLVRDALENENEINIYFHHEVDPIPEEVPQMLYLKCHPILKASNEDDLDDVPIDGHEEERDVGGDEEEKVGNPNDEDDNDEDEWFTDFSCTRKEIEFETDGYHSKELKNPISSDDEDEDVDKVYPQYNESSRVGEEKLKLRMEFGTLAEFKSALREYNIFMGREFKWKKNDKQRARAKCKNACCEDPFFVLFCY